MGGRYSLTRNYSLKSFIGIAIVAIALVMFYRYVAVDALKTQETKFNVALAKSLSETLWPKYAEFVYSASQLPEAQLPQAPAIKDIQRDVSDKVRGLRVVKVKIYDNNGLTVFSTDPSQIGDDKSNNTGFLGAMTGTPSSELVFKDRMSAFEQVIENRNVLSSYIPIQRDPSKAIQGVFEIYSDVTPLVEDINHTGYIILVGVTSLLLGLYLFLLVNVRRADRIIHKHEHEIELRHQAKIQHLSHFDALTDLPNRSHFLSLLEQAARRCSRSRNQLAVITVTIDKFKMINESLGHESADKVLVEVTQRLMHCCKDYGIVARIGGAQFGLIAEKSISKKAIDSLAQRMIGRFRKPLQVAGPELIITLSIGIAMSQVNADSAPQLLENAMAAMRKAKKRGRNIFIFSADDFSAKPRKRLEREMELRRAVTNHEFTLFYQPRISLVSGKIVATEALIRWKHPKHGIIQPGEFIHLLEDMDLMIPLGEWVIAEVCRQAKLWRDVGHTNLRISFNLSPRQFHSDILIDHIKGVLKESGLPASQIELELTESTLVEDTHHASTILHRLAEIGVGIAIDDFGTGYSSLSHLMHFPVNCIKIDRSFVCDISANRESAALTTAIVAMATSLKLTTVAEGIETQQQLDFLNSLGCTEVQGFYFSEAVPADIITEMLSFTYNTSPRTLFGKNPEALLET